MTEDPAEDERPSTTLGDPHDGPPGGRIFSLEGRRAPGLYLIAWLLSVGGLALLFVGVVAASDIGQIVLLVVGAVGLALGLAFAAGYQVVERRDRHPDRYRGPAPLLVFGIVFAWSTILSNLLVAPGLVDPETSGGFLALVTTLAALYLVVVWLFVVRTGALSWREMGWPARVPGMVRRILRDAGMAIAIMLPTTVGILLLGSIVASLLRVEAPEVLPTPSTSFEAFAVALGAAVIAPVGEELFFRGFALTAWLRDLGARTAIIRSTVLFAIVHIANITTTDFFEGAAQALLQVLVILPVGLVLGLLFVRHGMVGAIAGHVTYNTFLLLILALATILGVPDAAPSSPVTPGS